MNNLCLCVSEDAMVWDFISGNEYQYEIDNEYGEAYLVVNKRGEQKYFCPYEFNLLFSEY